MAHTRSTLKLGDQEYELVPVEYRNRHLPKLRTYEDETFKLTEDYKYTKLRGSRKKIRLLQLKGGAIDAPDIYCELTEADYDNRFHMPTSLDAPEKYKGPQNAKNMSEEQIEKDNLEAFEALQQYEIKYEALSWCWGTDVPNYIIFINVKDKNGQDKLCKLRVREQLALALKYLRYPDKSRTLWIDAICINQEDPSERNHQVQMMSRIYTRAKEVCIWLGDSDSDSRVAIPFIKKEIMELHNIDTLCSDKRYTGKWKALMMLMQRKRFSRRWVVQEIALANKATIHCGEDSMEWKQFAVAVELFVEVETATHRLSEIMHEDVKFQHVPGWFEYVSDLGASLLVQATGKVFRAQRSPLEDDPEDPSSEVLLERVRVNQTIDPLDRKSLLSLEYLVSTFFIFGASEPRDAVYAMLALSRDAAPFPDLGAEPRSDRTRLTMMTCEPFLEEKPFTVDYRRPYSEVCKDFVSFAIERRRKSDPSQALDVLCRPWALPPPEPGKRSIRLKGPPITRASKPLLPARNSPWILRTRDPSDPEKLRYLNDEGTTDHHTTKQYWEKVVNDWKPSEDWKRKRDRYFPPRKDQRNKQDVGEQKGTDAGEKKVMENKQEEDLEELPSWVAQVSQAPISLDYSPGIEPQITGRSYADPLVGSPQDGHRNYSAAQTRAPKLLKFRRRPTLKHYSLFVNGFILDEVDEVLDASQGGNIPSSWLDLAGWKNINEDPPIEFWRTLVADRGRDNRNPPYYYATACRESVNKGGITSGRIDTTALIHNERNSIVAEFCRRVHAVIWNRRLFKTKQGKLGLAINVEKDDKICILYGCTVPVILHQHNKTRHDLEQEQEEDAIMALKRGVREMERFRQRKADHIARKLKPEALQENREAREEAIKRIQKLDGTQSTKREQSPKSEGGARQGNDEKPRSETNLQDAAEKGDSKGGSREGPAERPREQTHVGQVSQAQGQQQQAESGGIGREAHSNDDVGHKARRFQKTKTGLQIKQEAAQKNDPLQWYEFRRDCYLHGMMDGEAIRERIHSQIEERTFELR